MKKIIVLILISLVLINCKEQPKQDDKQTNILNFLDTKKEEYQIPALQLAIVKNNAIVLNETKGLANVPFSVKADRNTIFSINSIAKIFAATAILQLEEQGKLSINDSIAQHIKGLPQAWRKVTLKQLLSHVSGLPDIEGEDDLVGGKGQDSAWVVVQKMPLQFKAGESFSYNATNYLLIQKLVEKYGHMPYEQYIKKNQFDIARMSSTFYDNSDVVKQYKASTYYYNYDEKTESFDRSQLFVTDEKFPTSLRADAGAFSTSEDMAKWFIALQQGKLLSNKESIAKMWKPTKLNNGSYEGFDDYLNSYALGWPVNVKDNKIIPMAIGGGRASVNVYPKDSLAVILLSNLSGFHVHQVADGIAKIYLEK